MPAPPTHHEAVAVLVVGDARCASAGFRRSWSTGARRRSGHVLDAAGSAILRCPPPSPRHRRARSPAPTHRRSHARRSNTPSRQNDWDLEVTPCSAETQPGSELTRRPGRRTYILRGLALFQKDRRIGDAGQPADSRPDSWVPVAHLSLSALGMPVGIIERSTRCTSRR